LIAEIKVESRIGDASGWRVAVAWVFYNKGVTELSFGVSAAVFNFAYGKFFLHTLSLRVLFFVVLRVLRFALNGSSYFVGCCFGHSVFWWMGEM
jgi:hypothetical protein